MNTHNQITMLSTSVGLTVAAVAVAVVCILQQRALDSFLYASVVRLNSKKYFLNVFLFDANLSSAYSGANGSNCHQPTHTHNLAFPTRTERLCQSHSKSIKRQLISSTMTICLSVCLSHKTIDLYIHFGVAR